MRAAVVRGAAVAAVINLAIWVLASVAGVAFASAGGVVAAGIVANRFIGTGARRRWDRVALVVLVLSIGSPIGLALGAIPVSPIDPTNELLISFKGGIAAIYAVLHLTTFAVVRRTVAEAIKG